MKLITGGAFQGKTKYIEEIFQPKQIVNGADATWEEICKSDCVMNFERFIWNQMTETMELNVLIERFQNVIDQLEQKNPDLILELQEMGCGIVPMKKEERFFRECCGRVGCMIAVNGNEVYRMMCGIAQKIQ